MRKMRWLGLAAMVFAPLAMAQASPEKVITQHGASFISGGVGIDSEERLKAREKEFNLKLVFILVEGNYLADIAVAIKDAKGKAVIEHVADGPFLMVRLPAGAYVVTATHDGAVHTRKVAVRNERLRTEYLRWPSKRGIDFPLPPESRR